MTAVRYLLVVDDIIINGVAVYESKLSEYFQLAPTCINSGNRNKM